MKNSMKHIIVCGLLAVSAGMGLSSCEDFLTITPTDRIVEEEFWQDKRDLNNAVMACYWRMTSGDLLTKYIYWGEGRSDNLDRSTETKATSSIANILNANLLPTYGEFDWTPMYNAINYCNKVLTHGPEVVENDESFSENDWRPIRAEIITLRALCHFYLVRTFGEVPYITEDYNNDSQELRASQSTQLTVLNNIISDLESVKDEAISDYGNTEENKGRITKKSIYALLADVYLWRASYKAGNNQPFNKVILYSNYSGTQTEAELISRHEDYDTDAASDYQQCVNYCDLIINLAMQEEMESRNKSGRYPGGAVQTLTLEDLLAPNESTSGGGTNPSAYNTVFGSGNSNESIFELQVDGTSTSNSMVTSLFWNIKDSKAGTFVCAASLFSATNEEGPDNLTTSNVFTPTDYRRWGTIRVPTSSEAVESNIIKYVAQSVTQTNSNNTGKLIRNNDPTVTTNTIVQGLRSNSNVNANWIVYRLSDIFLMKAEAITQLYTDDDNLRQAFNYVRTVFKRSNPAAYKAGVAQRTDSLHYESFSGSDQIESLVLAERQREFIGEGKRWYDLVRYALRRGNTVDMLKLLSRRSSSNGSAITAKLSHMQSLYSPVYQSEIKNNGWLYQNGVWTVNETSSRTDEM